MEWQPLIKTARSALINRLTFHYANYVSEERRILTMPMLSKFNGDVHNSAHSFALWSQGLLSSVVDGFRWPRHPRHTEDLLIKHGQ